MNDLVVGGGGFIGSHLTEALLKLHHKVAVLDRPDALYLNELAKQNAAIFAGDLWAADVLKKALRGADVVYHLASTTVPQTSNENPAFDVETNLIGSIRLFNAAKEAGVKKVVFPSSGGTVYGIPQEIPINENHPTDPISSYGVCKLAIEKYLHLFWTMYRLDYCILRISNVYGERQRATGVQGVVPAFIKKVLQGDPLIVLGDGSAIRDYVYIGDLVDALIKAAAYDGNLRIFNIGGGQGYSVNDIIKMLEYIIQRPLQPMYMPGRVFDVPMNVLDISRAKMGLHWQPTIGFLDGISRTFEWMKRQPT